MTAIQKEGMGRRCGLCMAPPFNMLFEAFSRQQLSIISPCRFLVFGSYKACPTFSSVAITYNTATKVMATCTCVE